MFAIATLPSPWRLRARALVIVWILLSVLYLGAPIRWNHLVGFALIVAAAFFIFKE